ncbi:AlkA N-terminal domain-containing protein [Pseudomarimonas salicorniae]|uniref:DNA-3-methyladenine glycosylase II n=1 Tax=Pseudomarimonas salicorniae TaxID=2933270 RepID=A0ABT0GF71_9GAMM|nr:AlkA N-terminal domain-containing protein [Lysobacter sp. CAU 1642]MCK7593195.1 helix-turn-helix domain-containing protein [Lysobacter sp. CAU 1642]
MDAFPDSTLALFSRARQARDARFDGRFFVAVTSTGIYCRPVCPAPPAHERNVRYFLHAAGAAAAGFRPCLRCRPELAPGSAPCDSGDRTVEAALVRIRQGALETGDVGSLAAGLGVGERQLRRLLVERVGAGPLDLHLNQCVLLAKQLLTESALPVTEVALASGFRSLRRFNSAFRQRVGMTPSALRAGRPVRDGGALTLQLGYRPPYDWDGILAFLRRREIAGVERISESAYLRVLPGSGRGGWLEVTRLPGRHALQVRLELPELTALPGVLRRLRRLFDLDADPLAIDSVLDRDPLLAALGARFPGQRLPGAFAGFESMVRAVLGQQVSVAAASTLMNRVVERYGQPVPEVQGFRRAFPTPAALAGASFEGIGVTSARAECLRGLSRAVADGCLADEPGRADPVEWRRAALALRGIGPWTADYMMMRVLHDPDAYPAGDLVLRQQLGSGRPLAERACEARSQPWRPWRAYALMRLWRAASEPPSAAGEAA